VSENGKLPDGWTECKLGEVLSIRNGYAFKSSDYCEIGIPLIRQTDLIGQLARIDKAYRLPWAFQDFIANYGIRNGDILIGMSGSIGKLCVYKNEEPALQNQRTGLIRFYDNGVKNYTYYYFQTLSSALARESKGIAVQNVSAGDIESLSLPLPPLQEQHRIVAKIEELFTRLDAGVEALKQIKQQLKRYRQAVLKHAFEGKLTQEWREAQLKDPNSPLNTEPAAVLLERIKAERKKALGKKYKELPPVDTTDLPELPEGWVWVRVSDITETMQYGTSEKADELTSGIPVLRMGNIQDGLLSFDNLKYYPKSASFVRDFLLRDGDVLFNRTNSAELVGKTAVYKGNHPKAVFASYLIRVQTVKSACLPELLSWYINSIAGRSYINSVVSQQVGQANVNSSKLAMMPVPIPCPEEQKEIVGIMDRCFSIANAVEQTIDQTIAESNRLRQSILKRAFKGKLVPQDPNDEPAEKLLERIRADREGEQERKKNGKAVVKKSVKKSRVKAKK